MRRNKYANPTAAAASITNPPITLPAIAPAGTGFAQLFSVLDGTVVTVMVSVVVTAPEDVAAKKGIEIDSTVGNVPQP